MEKTSTSVSVATCNSKKQDSLEVDSWTSWTSSSKSVTETGKHHGEAAEVMVECVSSTTEQSSRTVQKKLSHTPKSARSVSTANTKAMSQEQRNKEKQTHDKRDGSKSKPSKASHPLTSDDKDKTNDRQFQATHSASRKDSPAHFHPPLKKRIPKNDGRLDSEVSSSSLVLQSHGNAPSFKAQSKPGSSTYGDGKSSSKRALPEDSSREMSKPKHPRQDREMHQKGKHEEAVAEKIRTIRKNLEKMTNKLPKSLKGSLESHSASTQNKKKGSDERGKEEEDEEANLHLPFLPSSRCCSPPRPATVEKYWSDADDTEDESDSEKHMLHVNSVNIVLNFLKNNSGKYYVKEETVNKFEAIRAKSNKSGIDINERLSNLVATDSYQPYSRSEYSKRHGRGSPRQRNYSHSLDRELHGHGFSRSRSPVSHKQSSWRDQRSRSPSKHNEFLDWKRLSHSSNHVRESSSRNRGSYSPNWCENKQYRRSSSPLTNQRNLQRDSRLGSPRRHGRTSYRESHSPSRYRESFHRHRDSPYHVNYTESSSPYYTEDILSDSESSSWLWDAIDSLRNQSSFGFNEESAIREQKFSPSSQRYNTNTSNQYEDLHFQSVNPQRESRRDLKNSHTFRGSERDHHHRESREEHSRHKLSQRDQLLSRDREIQLKEKDSSITRTGHGSSPSSHHHSDSSGHRHDRHDPSHGRQAPGIDTPRPVSHEGSAESRTSVRSPESDLTRFTSGRKVSQKWQEIKRRNEIKLPVAFGKKSMKTLKIDEALGWDMNSVSFDKENQQKKEDIEPPKIDVISLDDDEPIIDCPEEYLNTSSTVPIYQPSFVPNMNDREKFLGLDETSELSHSCEDLDVAGSSGITSKFSGGKEKDDSPHRQSDTECDHETEDTNSTVPFVSSSDTSPEAVTSKETTSAQSSMLDSSAVKEVTTEVAQSEEEKAVLTLNTAEMSTLLTLIKLAKEHVATGKVLPTSLSQVLEITGDANNSKAAQPQREQSIKNQQEQCSVSQISKGIEDKSKSGDNAGIRNKTEGKKNDDASTSASKTACIYDKAETNISIGDGKNVNQVTCVTNKKDSIICTDKTEKSDFKKKKPDDPSQCKAIKKYRRSTSKVQEMKTDDKIPKGNENSTQHSRESIVQVTPEGKDKEIGQSSKNIGNVIKTPSRKQILHKQNKEIQLSKSLATDTDVENIFSQMQLVKVNLLASAKTISSRRRVNYCKGTARKEQLKQVGKRIYMNESDSDSDESWSPNPKKDESPDSSNQPQELHPLQQETIVLDHSVNSCRACKHKLDTDEYTTISLNTGTVTMRCRNCHTYTKMEKVLSPDYYTSTSISKNVASKKDCVAPQTSKASGPSVHRNNSRDHKNENVTSSKLKKNENTNREGRSLDSSKPAKKANKHSSEVKKIVEEEKIKTSACRKEKEKKLMLADTEKASKTLSVSRKDKSHSDERKAKGSSSSNKDRNSKTNEEKKILSEFELLDPHLCVFPWSSSRKRKKLFDDLELLEDNCSDDDKHNKRKEKQNTHKRKPNVPSAQRKPREDKTTAHSSKPSTIVKNTITTETNSGSKSSHHTSSTKTDPKTEGRKLDTPKATTATKPTSVPKTTAPKTPSQFPKPSTTLELTRAT